MYSGCYGPDRASLGFYIVAILYNSLIQFLNESIFKSYAFRGGKFGRVPPLLYPRSSFKILVVCPCVCDGCGRGRNEFAGRVQNHHVRFSFHRNGHINLFEKPER